MNGNKSNLLLNHNFCYSVHIIIYYNSICFFAIRSSSFSSLAFFRNVEFKMWTQFSVSLYDHAKFIESFNSIHTPTTRLECTMWFFCPFSSCLLFFVLCHLLLNIFFLEKNSNGSILIHTSHIFSRTSKANVSFNMVAKSLIKCFHLLFPSIFSCHTC